jgi:hypothetical protein
MDGRRVSLTIKFPINSLNIYFDNCIGHPDYLSDAYCKVYNFFVSGIYTI